MSNLAIYGGTFDPIHLGHLRVAQEAIEELSLTKVLFMPCAKSPFYKNTYLSSATIRLEMIRLAIDDNPRFDLTDLEIRRGGKSYTIDSLKKIKRDKPKTKLIFLLGADAFYSIHLWHQSRQLFELADFAVTTRPGILKQNILQYLNQYLDPTFTLNKDGWIRLPSGYGAKQILTTPLCISSTDIKRRIALGLSLTYLVPRSIEKYIKSMKLYTY